MNIIIRPASLSDIETVMQVCDRAWRNTWRGTKDMFIDRIQTFPECGIVVGEIDGKIEGYVSVQTASNKTILSPSWDEATDFGHFRKTHDPSAEWLHGVGLAVTLEGCKVGLTGNLINYLYNYMVAQNKRGSRFITRIPGYYRYQERMTPQEYVLSEHNGKSIDPELRVLGSYGFRVFEPPEIFTDYVEGGGDPASCGYSVLIELLNPHWANESPATIDQNQEEPNALTR